MKRIKYNKNSNLKYVPSITTDTSDMLLLTSQSCNSDNILENWKEHDFFMLWMKQEKQASIDVAGHKLGDHFI